MALVNLNYFGNPGLMTESPGQLVTDIYGLDTCTAVFKCPSDRFDLVPLMFSYHPLFPWVNMERRRLDVSPEGNRGYLVITGEFAGVAGSTEPIYELDLGLSEEPIQTHHKFVSEIAGTPSAPLHGAIFLDSEGSITEDDSLGVFDKFITTIDGDLNPFAGLESYLDFSNAIWRRTVLQTFPPVDLYQLGYIDYPDGPFPALYAGQNWLFVGESYIQRGLVYSVKTEWRASGRRGWNSTIYSP
jgi:hypothetical protein